MPVSEQAFEAVRNRVNTIERDIAVRDETDKSIEARLSKIETILSRLTWILVTGIGGAFVAFIISGGLQHVAIG